MCGVIAYLYGRSSAARIDSVRHLDVPQKLWINVAISVIAGTINVTVSDCINSVIKKIISVQHKTVSSN